MEENRFFRSVWRINGIAIMLLLIFIILVGGYNIIKEIFPHNTQTIITNVAQDPQGVEKWRLGATSIIKGTNYLFIPLVSEKKNISASAPLMMQALKSYDYFDPSRNLLFINKMTREMRWLFKDNRQLIENIDMLSVIMKNNNESKVNAILYQIITKDTNNDKKLGAEDVAVVAISMPDGTHYKEILQSVERIFGSMFIDEQMVLILYQSNGKGYASTIRLEDMSVLGTKEMPNVEQEKP